jgi:hypothetical protein
MKVSIADTFTRQASSSHTMRPVASCTGFSSKAEAADPTFGPETLCCPLPRRLALDGKTLQLPQD